MKGLGALGLLVLVWGVATVVVAAYLGVIGAIAWSVMRALA